ncbi:MAG: hypothetical protein Ct9H300mP27_02070 [Chloroflexota bacterium]|nr:MAG: hypothetical protein Ct9H300mP27_02070 [Chloroflexota bacterium]
MEKVSIQEASRRLHIATSEVRDCIRMGELIAERDLAPRDAKSGSYKCLKMTG